MVMDRVRSTVTVVVFLGLLVGPAGEVEAQSEEADTADVETIDGIIAALYAAIYGPVGQERNHDQFMSLRDIHNFIHGAGRPGIMNRNNSLGA